ncbi:GNAT family N-acetyltransferase [Mumia zhuanghuii]|uniref:GNAT family N-acetyltransferase n=2 Tax=Mumia TaxID=1546255 RepID=A0ABW1QQ67_9ACTN|nr:MULTISPECIES: GNAT family N-acetyltransferase [Mumia]KAA1422334.1 GNAT family N-acetyltransferase [Mumia zhuanghuii]
MMADRVYRPLDRWVAVADDSQTPESVVGHASVRLPQVGDTDVVIVDVGVDPRWRGRGIGTALAERVASEVRAAGRHVVQADTSHPRGPWPDADELQPSTGVGTVPVDASTRFALAHGLVLEQVERQLTIDLPVDPDHLARLESEAALAAGPDYRTHVWVDEVPAEWEEQYAALMTRMTTAPPAGGMAHAEDAWDVARLRAATARRRASGRVAVVGVVEHRPTGTLAAYSVEEFADSRPESVIQADTLVLDEHRGHRLGMLVKTALMGTLATVRPQARRIHTWNAQENAHMLAINTTLGYRPASVAAQWQLLLDVA